MAKINNPRRRLWANFFLNLEKSEILFYEIRSN